MKAVVRQLFMDKNIPGKKYFPGDVVDFDAERVDDLLKKGLVEKHKPQKEDIFKPDKSTEEKKVEKSALED